ncbi:MAG TPA: thioredoxin [Terriglobia bacterium]|jgi:thioredoxin 1|nr:thioredoxin [Terriglobia bacterium]
MTVGANTVEVTDNNFDTEVLKASGPVLVDFWAEWCGPCKAIAPTIEAVAKDYQGRAKITKLNVDQNIATSSRYNIKGIPTLLLFKNGMVKEQIVGSTSKESISKIIDRHL